MSHPDRITQNPSLGGLVDAALEIAGKRLDTLHRLRIALLSRQDAEALGFARLLCGLENDETGDRIDSSFD
jgi:hypothetical protein